MIGPDEQTCELESGDVILCDLGSGAPESGEGICGIEGDEETSYWFDFDSGAKVTTEDPSADLSKGHGDPELGDECCDWFVKNGALQAITRAPAAEVDDVRCGVGDGLEYSDQAVPYGQPFESVVCLMTPEGGFFKYTGRADCCGDIHIDWWRSAAPVPL